MSVSIVSTRVVKSIMLVIVLVTLGWLATIHSSSKEILLKPSLTLVSQGMSARADKGSWRVSGASPGNTVQLHLTWVDWGAADQRLPIPQPTVHAEQGRIEMRRPGSTEWFEAREDGLEHFWSLQAPPAFDHEGEVVLGLQMDTALHIKAEDAGKSLILRDPVTERTQLLYAGLKAWDQTNRRLPARMTVGGGGRIDLWIDDRDAQYPIVIDPLFANPSTLVGVDRARGDRFGGSVATDGHRLAVGTPVDESSGIRSGSVSVYLYDGVQWSLEATLYPNDPTMGKQFGHSVAIDGDSLLIGAIFDFDNGAGSGAVYAFAHNGVQWSQTQKIQPGDGLTGDSFGSALALSGDTAIIGAPQTSDLGFRAGSAYVFERTLGIWAQTAELTASDGSTGDLFASSLSMSRNTLIAGAPSDDDQGLDSGSVYLFEVTQGAWSEVQKINDPSGQAGDLYGTAVAIKDRTVLVGAPKTSGGGKAFVMTRRQGVWSLHQELISVDIAADHRFGSAVGISGGWAVIGAPDYTGPANNQGASVIFARSGSAWNQVDIFTGGSNQDQFGSALAVADRVVFIGAPNDGNGTGIDAGTVHRIDVGPFSLMASDPSSGQVYSKAVDLGHNTAVISDDKDAVYIYARTGPTWTEETKLLGVPGSTPTAFGRDLDLDHDQLAVGAPLGRQGSAQTGLVSIYLRNASNWSAEATLTASDGAPDDRFGQAVALADDLFVAGAPGRQEGGNITGAAYVFRRGMSGWTEEAKLLSSDASDASQFGQAIATDGTRIFVGAPNRGQPLAASGAIYVYERIAGTWTETQILQTNAPTVRARFGERVAVLDNQILIAASGETGGGAVYSFAPGMSAWTQTQRIQPSDLIEGDRFGSGLGAFGGIAAIGAKEASAGHASSGAVFIYRWNGLSWGQIEKWVEPAPSKGLGSDIAVFQRGVLSAAPEFDRANGSTGNAFLDEVDTNSAPRTADRDVRLTEDTESELVLDGLDWEGSHIQYRIETVPQHGQITGTPPALIYTPEDDFAGFDSLVYVAFDEYDESASTTIAIEVQASNDQPTIQDRMIATQEDTPTTFQMQTRDPDGDPLQLSVVQAPVYGRVTIDNLSITYTPDPNFFGNEIFQVAVTDGVPFSSTSANVLLSVTPVNDPPTVSDQEIEVVADTSKEIPLVGHDVEGDALVYEIINQPEHGSLSKEADKVTFVPTAGYVGSDSFSFVAQDQEAASEAGVISLSIVADNTDLCLSLNCAEGALCVAGACRIPCQFDANCPDGEKCYDGLCGPDACTLAECDGALICVKGGCFSACEADTDCAAPETCQEGRCAQDLCDRLLCPASQSCLEGRCRTRCDNPDTCTGSDVCYDGLCQPDPCSSLECGPGQACLDGACYSVYSTDDEEGCQCRIAAKRNNTTPWWLLLGLFTLSGVRGRRRRA
jgi:hypothetical protein